jgi:hypothetical protein
MWLYVKTTMFSYATKKMVITMVLNNSVNLNDLRN